MAYSTTTLTGTYTLFDGTAAQGVIEIIPSEKVVKDTTGDVILSGRVKVTLDAAGKFSVDLPSTDDATLNPTGFGYTLVAKLHHQHIAAVSFSLPAGSPVDIEDVTPVDPSTFTPDATYVQSSELATVATTGAYTDLNGTPVIPTTAADVGALPDTTVIPSTAADVGALPDTTTATDIGGETPTGAQAKVDTLAATLPNTYAGAKAARPGNRFVAWGDSITKADDTPSVRSLRHSWPVYAALESKQRLNLRYNAGVHGDTTAQMLARFDTDVAPYEPSVVSIMGGTNDVGQSIPLATTKANIQTMVEKVRSIGATPVLCTILPTINTTPTDRRQKTIALNAWVRQYASEQGLCLLDFFGTLIDPATGAIQTAYASGDGIHPNETGYVAMGKYAATTLTPLLPEWVPALPQDNGDPNNLLTNGLFITDGDANGIADGWTNQSGITGQTLSLVTDSAIKGKWQRIVTNASSGTTTLFQSKSTPAAEGQRFLIVGRVKASFTTGNLTLRIRWTATPNFDDLALDRVFKPIDNGLFYLEADAPPGASAMQVGIVLTAGTAQVDVAQFGVYNLTAMGVV